jgi:hypothetical protein
MHVALMAAVVTATAFAQAQEAPSKIPPETNNDVLLKLDRCSEEHLGQGQAVLK